MGDDSFHYFNRFFNVRLEYNLIKKFLISKYILVVTFAGFSRKNVDKYLVINMATPYIFFLLWFIVYFRFVRFWKMAVRNAKYALFNNFDSETTDVGLTSSIVVDTDNPIDLQEAMKADTTVSKKRKGAEEIYTARILQLNGN